MKNIILLFFVIIVGGLYAGDEIILQMEDFSSRSYEQSILQVDETVTVQIQVRGGWDKPSSQILATGWILNSQNREVVWSLNSKNAKAGRGRWDCSAENAVKLDSGTYEVYYAVSPLKYKANNHKPMGNVISDLFGKNPSRSWNQAAKKWGLRLSADPDDYYSIRVVDSGQQRQQNVSLALMGDGEYEQIGFELSEEQDIRVYAIGEGMRDGMADYGWLVDADSYETLWEMTYQKTDWAGGANKNRITDQILYLPAGRYVLYYVTDGSHAFGSWNRLMPYDPHYWGVTIFTENDRTISTFKPNESENQIVNMTRAGNHADLHEQFMVNHPLQVRILCMGEMSRKKHFDDYGWILNSKTRQKVWQLNPKNCVHAGGDEKNQMAQEILQLDPGTYEVYYVTDDSHAYPEWNASPPFNPQAWGISLWSASPDFQPDWINTESNIMKDDILVQFIRAGDDEHFEDELNLDETTKVRIIALGEGSDGEMYDYGWIEDESGKAVWRMRFRNTKNAGGAKKNRKINEVLILPAGAYTVYYESDGSHSYEDWNTDPPEDPVYWGITVRKEQ
ncbi:hypothetical protein HQ585_10725 [candidate division KSB1 bacterium]|nr:hypothetical protein [candidate division KSB1 bacterium]